MTAKRLQTAEMLLDQAITFLRYIQEQLGGESGGGCTGDDAFHGMLEQAWEEVACVSLPQFPSIHDDLTIYRRNGARGAFAPEM